MNIAGAATGQSTSVNKTLVTKEFNDFLLSHDTNKRRTVLSRLGVIAGLRGTKARLLTRSASDDDKIALINSTIDAMDEIRLKKLNDYIVTQKTRPIEPARKSSEEKESGRIDEPDVFSDVVPDILKEIEELCLDPNIKEWRERMPDIVGAPVLEEAQYNLPRGIVIYKTASYAEEGQTFVGRVKIETHSNRSVFLTVASAREQIAEGIPPGKLYALKTRHRPDILSNRFEAVLEALGDLLKDNKQRIPAGMNAFCIHLSVGHGYKASRTLFCINDPSVFESSVHEGEHQPTNEKDKVPVFKVIFSNPKELVSFTDFSDTTDISKFAIDIKLDMGHSNGDQDSIISMLKDMLTQSRENGAIKEQVKKDRSHLVSSTNYF